MKQAIKVLEKRIELLNKEYEKKDKQFEDCEMVCDYDFLQNDLINMELEIIELQKAIELLNKVVNYKPQKCKCRKATFTRTVDADFNCLCGKCGHPI